MITVLVPLALDVFFLEGAVRHLKADLLCQCGSGCANNTAIHRKQGTDLLVLVVGRGYVAWLMEDVDIDADYMLNMFRKFLVCRVIS